MHSNTEPKLHDLLYLKEHLTCNRYLADIRTGFVFKKLKKGNMFGLEQGLSHQLLVFLEGSCTIDYGCFLGKKFSAGEMVLIHRRSSYVGQVTDQQVKKISQRVTDRGSTEIVFDTGTVIRI